MNRSSAYKLRGKPRCPKCGSKSWNRFAGYCSSCGYTRLGNTTRKYQENRKKELLEWKLASEKPVKFRTKEGYHCAICLEVLPNPKEYFLHHKEKHPKEFYEFLKALTVILIK